MKTTVGKTKDADILTALDDRKIAMLRLGFAVSALFLIFLDPTQLDRHITLTNFALVLYTSHSVAIYWIASLRKNLSWNAFVATVVADITLSTVLVSLNSGTNSVFFFFYFFGIIVGGMRGGSTFGFAVTVLSTSLFTIFGYIGTAERDIDIVRFLLRPIYLMAVGYVISLWAGAEINLKRKLGLLKQLSLTENPGLNMERIVADLLERLLIYYNARAAILVVVNPDGVGYRLHRFTRNPSRSVPGAVAIHGEDDCPLLHLSSLDADVYCERNRFRGLMAKRLDGETVTSRRELMEWTSRTGEWLNAASFLTAPMWHRKKFLGQICLVSSRRAAFDAADAAFLEQIVDQIVPVFENVRLIDRWATEAADRERGKIARSIHDRVIQPYLGLQMGIDFVRRSMQSELDENPAESPKTNGLKSVELLDRLAEMTKEGVEELREYIYGLRRSAGRHARLVDSIRRFGDQFADVTGIEVRIVDNATNVVIHDRLAAEVFQMVTEALSNVRRHTHANWVTIHLESVDNMLTIRCENDDTREPSERHEFRPGSIADRAEALGGRAQISSAEGSTTVLVEVPL
jgi:signal transduction histidine kinase